MGDSQTRPQAQTPVATTAAPPRRKSLAREYIEAIFIAVLLVGYVYAWKKGALEWD